MEGHRKTPEQKLAENRYGQPNWLAAVFAGVISSKCANRRQRASLPKQPGTKADNPLI
jgi:hypothetical protein